jgi:hypothetical protein
MGKGAITIGILFLLLGFIVSIIIIVSEAPLWFLLHPGVLFLFIVGIGLVIFNKEENKIEQRKDINKKKDK